MSVISHIESSKDAAKWRADKMRRLGRNARVFKRLIRAGGAVLYVYVVVTKPRAPRQSPAAAASCMTVGR